MPLFMNHSQHFDKVVRFDLVKNPVGIKSEFAHGVFIQFRHFVPLAGQLIQDEGFEVMGSG
jgi:hypothetical protein